MESGWMRGPVEPLMMYLCLFVRGPVSSSSARRYMIECARWLATGGRLAECAKYVTIIAHRHRYQRLVCGEDAAATGASICRRHAVVFLFVSDG